MKSELAPATQAKVLELRVVKGEGSKPSRKVGATEQIDDKVLVERAARGDGIAFSELVNRHYEKAVRVSFGMLKDRFDAEDVAQEAFARVYRKLESFEGQSAFSTWLYRIVVNLSIDSLRKRKRQRRADVDDEMTREALRSDEELWPVFDQADPMLSVERRELRARLDAAFAELPEIHRAVLVLREVQGLSYEEIADALEIKKGTVMSRLFHARKAMQKLLTQEQGAEVV